MMVEGQEDGMIVREGKGGGVTEAKGRESKGSDLVRRGRPSGCYRIEGDGRW